MTLAASMRAILGVARKEFLHILRDWRILILLLILPPGFTFIFGYAFEQGDLTDAPALLQDADRTPQSEQLVERLRANKTFAWRDSGITAPVPSAAADPQPQQTPPSIDLLGRGLQAAVIIPPGWGASLRNGDPIPLQLVLDGTDTTTCQQLEGAVQTTLGEYQLAARDEMIEQLPDVVLELGRQIPVEVRKQFTSSMTPWSTTSTVLYNPEEKFINFIMPGIVGLILQLLTVTMMACTITREREAGTLSQLLVAPLSRTQIVLGKVLPYLVISMALIALTLAVGYFHFDVEYRAPLPVAVLCLLFLLCSLGTGLLISAFSQTQAQAIQIAVLYLLPVFPLSGAFGSLDQLPEGIRTIAQCFPLTHYCQAFRLVSLGGVGWTAIAPDLAFLLIGAIVTCGGAALLMRRMEA